MLTYLQDMQDPEKLRTFTRWKAHQLTGDRHGFWSLHVTRNWRLTFQIEDDQICDVNYEDYHGEEKTMRMLNPVHPGPFLRSEIIEAYNLSVTEAAKADLSGELALVQLAQLNQILTDAKVTDVSRDGRWL